MAVGQEMQSVPPSGAGHSAVPEGLWAQREMFLPGSVGAAFKCQKT